MKKIFVLIVLSLLTAITAAAQCSNADKKALEAFDRAWAEAGQKGDKAALMNIYADDFMALPNMTGKKDAIDNTMTAFEESRTDPDPAPQATYDRYMISCTPVTATITHRNTFTAPSADGKEPQTFYSRSIHFLEKRGGKWQVVSNAGGGALTDSQTLWYMEHDWSDAYEKKDTAWFERNFASDFRGISSGSGKISNKKESIAAMLADKEVVDYSDLTELDVRVDGDTAVVTGMEHIKGKDEAGKAFDRKVRYTDVYKKRDGRWQVVAGQGTRVQ